MAGKRSHKTTSAPEQEPPPAEQREVEWLSISSLMLDPLNPRLPDGMEDADQPQLVSALASDYRLLELGRSLADNGYFAEEPLVAVPGQRQDTWTVVEGNRRLAAVKLLESPSMAPKSQQKAWHELSSSRKRRITNVPALVYPRREDVTPYLGFRHITGVLEWEPYQKARYIAQLVEQQEMTFAQIAREIGSKAPHVREHYVAYCLVRQCRDEFGIDTQPVQDSFSVLRRALSDPDIKSFIGVAMDQSEKELSRPVPRDKHRDVADLLIWMFGSEDRSRALTDSRDLRKLGVVLSKGETVDVLRASGRLDYAYELTGGEEARLIESLNRASYSLDQSLSMLVRHKMSQKVRDAIARCRATIEALEKLLGK